MIMDKIVVLKMYKNFLKYVPVNRPGKKHKQISKERETE